MIEPTLNVDAFRRNSILTGDDVYLRHIYNLLVMKPGTDPLNYEKGIDFNSYYYQLVDHNELRSLEQKIKDQVTNYLGYYLRSVSVQPVKQNGKTILCCFISLNPADDRLLISTNGQIAQLTKIKKFSEQIN